MPASPVPEALLAALAVATIGVYMFRLGLAIGPDDYLAGWRRPSLMLRGLFCNLVAVPVLVIVVARAFDVPRGAEVGMVLMAISPGAPIALRRALGAGADEGFAVSLQVTLIVVAVASMPLSIALLDEVYATRATMAPETVARQIALGQLLPLGLGFALRRWLGARRSRVEPLVARGGAVLLVLLVIALALEVWTPVLGAKLRVALAILVATALALALGHVMGGPDRGTRTALAVATSARNAGLALLVVSVNRVPPEVQAAVLAWLVLSSIAVTPYVRWRGMVAEREGFEPSIRV